MLRYAEVQAASTVRDPVPGADRGDEDFNEEESGLAAGGEFDGIGNGLDGDDENGTGIDLAITTDRNTRPGSD